MVYKDKCYNYEELNEEKLKQFSEGSNSLESLLKYCYKNKIITRACCIGHNNEESDFISKSLEKKQIIDNSNIEEYIRI